MVKEIGKVPGRNVELVLLDLVFNGINQEQRNVGFHRSTYVQSKWLRGDLYAVKIGVFELWRVFRTVDVGVDWTSEGATFVYCPLFFRGPDPKTGTPVQTFLSNLFHMGIDSPRPFPQRFERRQPERPRYVHRHDTSHGVSRGWHYGAEKLEFGIEQGQQL